MEMAEQLWYNTVYVRGFLVKKYYICDNCHFQFERTGDCDRCPDCGKEQIREANEEEKKDYLSLKAEFNR